MQKFDHKLKKELQKKSLEMRIETVRMLEKAGSGHIGGAFSIADVLIYLYYYWLKIDPAKPKWDDRDYLLFSNGHVCPIWYTVLADKQYFGKEELGGLRKIDSLLQGHPRNDIPGVENSSGPLGHGLSQAIGIALGLKLDKKKNRVFCIMSDGEQQEGQIMEAAMSANKFKLDNLVAIIDKNFIQIEGTTDEIMPLGSLQERYESMGWIVMNIDGHNFDEIDAAFNTANNADRPVLIIANTIAGKGVSFMEHNPDYHDWKGLPGEAEKAIAELEMQREEI